MYRKRGRSDSDQLFNHKEPRKNARTEFNKEYIDAYVPGGTPRLAPGLNWDAAVGSGEWVVRGAEEVEPNTMYADHARAMINHGGAATEQGDMAAEQGSAAAEQGSAAAEQGSAAAEQGSAAAEQESAAAEHEDTPVADEDDESGCTDDSDWEDDYVDPPPAPKKPPVEPRFTPEQILSFGPYKYDILRSEILLLSRRELLLAPENVQLPDIWGGPLSVPDKVEMLFDQALVLTGIDKVSYSFLGTYGLVLMCLVK